MQLPFFDMVERARKMISFYGIYQANDKIELAELKSNHLRQEIKIEKPNALIRQQTGR
jgi:hypothetical protein